MRRIEIRFKPLTLNVSAEREDIYNRLKGMMEKAEAIANDTSLEAKIRLRAMQVLAKLGAVLAGTGILRDVQLDRIEETLKKLEKERATRKVR